jgi:membrane protein DedA with SNARE-associated domain
METIGSLGYPGIFILMFLESSFFPFPSEVVMIPAGYLAQQGEMNLAWVFACGLAGSLSGALFNYWLAMKVGRSFLLRYGRYLMMSPATLEKMEQFFDRHGEISTFNGRLLPGVRQYISLPAGIARMPIGRFTLYTGLGAGLWITVLVLLGYFLGANETMISRYLAELTWGVMAFVVLSSLLYYWWVHRNHG